MHWILQNNVFNEAGYDVMEDVLKRFSVPFSVHKVIPFVGQIEPDADPDGPVICMGSYALRHLAKERNWKPGVWDLAEQDFLVQRERWGAHMLNYDCGVVEFQNAKIDGQRAFVRPIDDTKVFAGTVFEAEEFEAWRHKICDLNKRPNGTTIANDSLVQICQPKEIYAEYRFWVVRGQIVTSSLYKRGTTVIYENGAPESLNKYVLDRIQEWEPDEAFVIDAAYTPDGYKIIEINTLNSSGFYKANMLKLIMTIDGEFG